MAKVAKSWKPLLLWVLLIGLYGYWQLLPEVSLVNGSGMTIKHIEILIPDDDKVFRQLAPGASKSFRYHPRGEGGVYRLRIVMLDGSVIKDQARIIKAWNFGHKVVFELLPDKRLRIDRSYSLYQGA